MWPWTVTNLDNVLPTSLLPGYSYFWLHFSSLNCLFLCFRRSLSLCLSLSPCLCLSVSTSVSESLPTVLTSCVSVWFFLSSAHHPLRGPGRPPESAPPVPDDPRHGGLLLRLHAPGLDAPQLNRLCLWTFAGQRHGESGRLLVGSGEMGEHRGVGRTSTPPSPTPLQFLHRSRSF